MGIKLCWTGLTILSCGAVVNIPAAAWIGGAVMIIGCILLWLDR